MSKFLAIFFLLMAQNWTVPSPPPLPSPTPFPTPTNTPIPSGMTTEVPTINAPLEEIDNALATVEYELEQPVNIQTPPQIAFLANMFGFLKWFSQNDRALLGPFAPLLSFLLFMTPIAFGLFVIYIGNLIVSVIWSIVSDILKKISDLIPG